MGLPFEAVGQFSLKDLDLTSKELIALGYWKAVS